MAQFSDQDNVPTLLTISTSMSQDDTYTELQCHQVFKSHETDCVEYLASLTLAEDDAACLICKQKKYADTEMNHIGSCPRQRPSCPSAQVYPA